MTTTSDVINSSDGWVQIGTGNADFIVSVEKAGYDLIIAFSDLEPTDANGHRVSAAQPFISDNLSGNLWVRTDSPDYIRYIVSDSISTTIVLPDDTYANIVEITGYPTGTKAFATDINLEVRYNGTGWEPVETIYSIMPISSMYVNTSPPNTATYTQSAYTVTVSGWTSHGIPAQYDGASVYLPASTSIAAGWYYDLTVTGTNTFTCRSLVSQTVASETPASSTAEINLPTGLTEPTGSQLVPIGAQLQIGLYWDAKNSAATKSLRMYSYGVQVNTTATRTTSTVNAAVTSSTVVPMAGDKMFIIGSNPSTPVSKVDSTHKISLQHSATDAWSIIMTGFMQVRK